MNSIQDILNQYRNTVGGRSGDDESTVGDAFSKLFNNRMQEDRSRGGSFLDRLAEQFPGVSFGRGTVPAGLEAAAEHYKTKAGDQVTVSDEAADKMATDSSFASTVQEAIQAMLSGNNLLGNVPGATSSQIGISVTVITIRYTEVHYGAGGDMMAGTDWTGDLTDRLQKLLEDLFQLGKKPGEATEDETAEAGKEDSTESAKATNDKDVYPIGTMVVGWSMSVVYSHSVLSSLQESTGNYQAVGASASFGVGAATFAGMKQATGFLSGTVPAGIFQNGIPSLFSTPFFNGLNISSYSMSQNNLLFNMMNPGKSALSDLWNLLDASRDGLKPVEAEPVGGESEAIEEDAVAPVA